MAEEKSFIDRLLDFIQNAAGGEVFRVKDDDVALLTANETDAVNGALNNLRTGTEFRVEAGPRTIKITRLPIPTAESLSSRIAEKSEAVRKDMAGKLRGPQEGIEGDKRVEEAPAANNPFRPRYRKLGLAEAEHHDAIKNKAFELWELINGIPHARELGSDLTSGGGVQRDMAMARTHLEDVVMRAVRALTA